MNSAAMPQYMVLGKDMQHLCSFTFKVKLPSGVLDLFFP